MNASTRRERRAGDAAGWVVAVCLTVSGCAGTAADSDADRASSAPMTTTASTPATTTASTIAPTSASTTSTSAPLASGTGLRSIVDRGDIEIGTAVTIEPLRNEPDYRAVLATEFSMVVAEDELKWDALRPSRDEFDFSAADEIVAFAEEHDIAVRGHTLVWFNALPAWLEGLELTRDEAIALLEEHIQTVVGRYRGRITQWDVVNEALPEGEASGLRNNVWLRWIGEDYIDLAFRFAREADPDAELYLNDYDWETPGPKTNGIIELARQLQKRGVPIDGVGIQFHVLGDVDLAAVEQNLQAVADLGLDVALTEVDNGRTLPLDQAALDEQAAVFGGLLETCLRVDRCNTFMMWGFTDRHSWIPAAIPGFGGALIFDEALQPKPAYAALRSALERLRDAQPGEG
jgi:endo-1,4-beta-xylanase